MNSVGSAKLEKLFSHIPNPRIGKHGIANKDIARIVVTTSLLPDILDCLESKDELDITFALFFLEELKVRPDFRVASSSALKSITARIRELLHHANVRIRVDAARAFVAFRDNFSDYHGVMLDLLGSSDAQIKRIAVAAAPTFLSPKNLGELLRFRNEPTFGETGGMGGPMRYDLRDLALQTAEQIAGKSFYVGDCSEHQNGIQISWRSWSAFATWLESKKKWRLFGK